MTGGCAHRNVCVCVPSPFISHTLCFVWRLLPLNSWTVLYGIDTEPQMTQYLSSIYWAFTTLSTVGYGDIR